MAKKTERISILVTEEQKARWQAEADKRGKSMPEFIRHCVDTYITLMEKVKRQQKAIF